MSPTPERHGPAGDRDAQPVPGPAGDPDGQDVHGSPHLSAPEVLGDAELQSSVLEDLRSAHNYRGWLAGLASAHLGDDPIDIGSGTGDYAAEWARPGRRVTASEAEPGRLAELRRRFADAPGVEVVALSAPVTETGEHTAAVAINVLEHIEDDVGALRSFAGLVRPGGRVVILVPAFELAMSRFDRDIGHVRRYRRHTLGRAARQAGLEVEQLHYVNAPGLLAWLLLVRLLRGRPRDGVMLKVFDRLVVPVLRRIEARVRPPFGQSVFLVARVPG